MVYYVYLEPDVFAAAGRNSPYGIQALIAALRGFLQNCCVMEFDDSRIQHSIGEKVKTIIQPHDHKTITTLLNTLAKRNRFVYCLSPDYTDKKTDRQCMFEQASTALIDMALLESKPTAKIASVADLQIATLEDYQNTYFEMERAKISSEGRICVPGQMANGEFLDGNFKKAFRHASKITVCDRVFGEHFKDNFKYTALEIIRWIGNVLNDAAAAKLCFHCGEPRECTQQYMQDEIRAARDSAVPDLMIAIQFYADDISHQLLPHDRFIMTDQFCFSIGRGLDFLDRSTGRNRDVSLSIISQDECQKVLDCYAPKRTAEVVL